MVRTSVCCRLPAAEIEYGQRISSAAVGRLACAASIRRTQLEERQVPVAVGHARRTLTPRDGDCLVHGCDVPAPYCEGHRVVWYCLSRRTKLDPILPSWPAVQPITPRGWSDATIHNGAAKQET